MLTRDLGSPLKQGGTNPPLAGPSHTTHCRSSMFTSHPALRTAWNINFTIGSVSRETNEATQSAFVARKRCSVCTHFQRGSHEAKCIFCVRGRRPLREVGAEILSFIFWMSSVVHYFGIFLSLKKKKKLHFNSRHPSDMPPLFES
jgi:hypothetical protein